MVLVSAMHITVGVSVNHQPGLIVNIDEWVGELIIKVMGE